MSATRQLFSLALAQACSRGVTRRIALSAPATAFMSAVALTLVMSSAGAQEQAPNNTGARVVGAVAGGLLANALTGNANNFWKVVLIGGGAYAGQAIGDSLTKPPPKPVVVQVPVSASPTVVPIPRPGAFMPSSIPAATYAEALTIAAAPSAVPAQTGADGRDWRALAPDAHTGLYGQMVDMVATRTIARIALDMADNAQMSFAVADDANKKAAQDNLKTANDNYRAAFDAYGLALRKVSATLVIAEKSGFDVQAQKLLLGGVPKDVRGVSSFNVVWPGVQDRITEIALKSDEAGGNLKYSDMVQGRNAVPVFPSQSIARMP
jgi:hypothetical protein